VSYHSIMFDIIIGFANERVLSVIHLLPILSRRNMYRGTRAMCSCDAMCLQYVKDALQAGIMDSDLLSHKERMMLLFPLTHSENVNDHHLCMREYSQIEQLLHANNPLRIFKAIFGKHLEVVEQFGRFPHRNAILGRRNTAEEESFLQQNNSSFCLNVAVSNSSDGSFTFCLEGRMNQSRTRNILPPPPPETPIRSNRSVTGNDFKEDQDIPSAIEVYSKDHDTTVNFYDFIGDGWGLLMTSRIGHKQVVHTLEDLKKKSQKETDFQALPLQQQKTQVRWELQDSMSSALSGNHIETLKFLQSRYGLCDEDLQVISSHFALCQETNQDIRWDLVFGIIFPDSGVDWDHWDRIVDPLGILVACALKEDTSLDDHDILSQALQRQSALGDWCNRHVCLTAIGGGDFIVRPADGGSSDAIGKHLVVRRRILEDVKQTHSIKVILDLEDALENQKPASKGYAIVEELLVLARQLDHGEEILSEGSKQPITLDDIRDIFAQIRSHEERNSPVPWDLVEHELRRRVSADDNS
jgi:uncharacterized protein (DUF924 family)